MVKKNVRIQLFEKGDMISDRLISQTTEFYQGPKQKHTTGPIRIEFTIEDQKDAKDIINYIKKLSLDLPIKQENRGRKISTNVNSDLNDINELEELINTLREEKDQDKFIKELRKNGFVFVTFDYVEDKIPSAYKIKDKHKIKYQWLIKRSKIAKDPRNDKYDPRILIGISIMFKRKDLMVLYVNGEFKENFKIKIPHKAISFKKTNLIKYPHYMHHDERVKWGVEHRILLNDETKNKSKFYIRWEKDIEVGNELKLKQNAKKVSKKGKSKKQK